ncbi:polysaccharide pyruvyl transferase family protein [Clostridium chromiireducens]|uniref:Polysaccharide pyruvyl transferase n=1 Tax=Clostridium chromiireducens TaxID=225345 RepID=A0A1V4IQY8_9CLOT|nr:polysaccharide pyruvyl transferase family protein [Clostridium chromiireducens]OPJ61897.1 polysaccharide pyruvyl transferase [Clostridium chromiireducens]
MKIAILTMSNGINYGNRLQNYATQKVLESLGCEVETIRNFTSQKIVDPNTIKERIKEILSDFYYRVPIIELKKMNYVLRERKFNEFTEKYVQQTNYIITKDRIPKGIEKMYDFFVCGSDQVWNPEFDINSEIDFLTFANKGQKIAYAPSFGVSELPMKCINDYKKWIGQIDCLSIREQAGADIIKELTGRDAVVLVDPTLMLTKNEWLLISKKPKLKLPKKYILTYFLGDKSKSAEEKINYIAKKNNLDVINFLDFSNKYIYSLSPHEFIWLFNKCELVYTDSFHGSVFSLIMKKPFIVFDRQDNHTSMNSRLDTLLSLFKMESRREENITNDNQIFNIDFTNVDSILEVERSKAFIYLKDALKLKNDKR